MSIKTKNALVSAVIAAVLFCAVFAILVSIVPPGGLALYFGIMSYSAVPFTWVTVYWLGGFVAWLLLPAIIGSFSKEG